ncbi:sensor domain-containing protein [Streptomyces formicae]|uniref:histidine kinase n=1 Tax=Streptomyces formicae TaxID=1616117 RepID=A0ABY3WJH5_9ACTN|nr:sensor domain-containing protein [Streptomyces formicae]UNM12752.1 sensor domain-containing protein [Streptomyces formicae]
MPHLRTFLGAPREAAYTLLAPFPGFVCGVVLLALLAVSLVTSVTQVGLVLLVGVLAVARGTGALHRGLLRGLLGEDIAAPPAREKAPGLVGSLRAALTDSDGWRAAAFTIAYAPVGVVLFVVSVGMRLYGLAGLTYPLWWRAVEEDGRRGVGLAGDVRMDSWLAALLTAAAGLAVLAFAAWSTRGLLTLVVRPMARALLGRGRLDDRVHVLEETRALAVQDSAATLRRIERDLHDGAQSRLIAVAMALAGARDQLARAPGDAPELARGRELVDSALGNSRTAIAELRDLVRGIHPPALNDGLDVALETLATRAGLPVTTRVDLPVRPPEAIASIAYFCAAELVANAARHAGASRAEIEAYEQGGVLRLVVRDDGHGGARMRTGRGVGGTGLTGLAERVSTVDGRLLIDSPDGGPTTVTAELPLGQESPACAS